MTDAYIIEPSFLVSAEARKLDMLAKEQAAAYAKPSILRTLKKGAQAEAEPAPTSSWPVPSGGTIIAADWKLVSLTAIPSSRK